MVRFISGDDRGAVYHLISSKISYDSSERRISTEKWNLENGQISGRNSGFRCIFVDGNITVNELEMHIILDKNSNQ